MNLATALLCMVALAAAPPATAPGTARVIGQVVQRGMPIPSANVAFPGARRGAQTDGDGKFELSDVPFGTHRLVISTLDSTALDTTVVVPPISELDLGVLELVEGGPYATGTIIGTVRAGERPGAGANVIVLGTRRGARADSNGAFTVTRAPIGTHQLKALLDGESKSVAVTVFPAETTDVESISLTDMNLEGPVVVALDSSLVVRLRTSRVESVERVRRALRPGLKSSEPSNLAGYDLVARRDPPPEPWSKRLHALLEDRDAYRVYPGKVKKLCVFTADVGVRFVDAKGPVDLWLCFGCGDLALIPGNGPSDGRDIGPLYGDYLDLALEAFPDDPKLQAHRPASDGGGAGDPGQKP